MCGHAPGTCVPMSRCARRQGKRLFRRTGTIGYVSDKGICLFARRAWTVAKTSNQIEEREPGNTKNYTGNSSAIRFEGNQLVAITGQVSGANLMRATFDSSFSSTAKSVRVCPTRIFFNADKFLEEDLSVSCPTGRIARKSRP